MSLSQYIPVLLYYALPTTSISQQHLMDRIVTSLSHLLWRRVRWPLGRSLWFEGTLSVCYVRTLSQAAASSHKLRV